MSFNDKEYEAARRVVADNRKVRAVVVVMAFVFLAATLAFIHYEFSEFSKRLANSVEDIKAQNEETRRYMTCITRIPFEDRTEETQRKCFESSNVPGGLDPADFTPASASGDEASVRVAPSSPAENSFDDSVPSPNTTRSQSPPQPDSSQQEQSPTPYPPYPPIATTPADPSYADCIASKPSVLSAVGGLVTCL